MRQKGVAEGAVKRGWRKFERTMEGRVERCPGQREVEGRWRPEEVAKAARCCEVRGGRAIPRRAVTPRRERGGRAWGMVEGRGEGRRDKGDGGQGMEKVQGTRRKMRRDKRRSHHPKHKEGLHASTSARGVHSLDERGHPLARGLHVSERGAEAGKLGPQRCEPPRLAQLPCDRRQHREPQPDRCAADRRPPGGGGGEVEREQQALAAVERPRAQPPGGAQSRGGAHTPAQARAAAQTGEQQHRSRFGRFTTSRFETG